ncbi:hypothetical protein [Acaryochloris sp. CCMEE 5410]|uniref:hypothetical protein n=1 Tax=Acaryochloris sp. CCMEE 5410 TaxID=310037 RepID=UPI0002483FB7|nr:hypothetical protein [Acaryochloris sp. CCMEE 5410]
MQTAVTPVGNPVYWITFGPRINKPTETNITFPGTKLDLVESILHILSIHWDAWEYGRNAIQDFPNLEEAIFSEHVCYLLQKYYGATHQPNVDPEAELDEIDLYDVWNWKHLFFSDEETHTDLADCLLNPELMAGINHRRYKPGLALEVHAMTLQGFEDYERYIDNPKASLAANPSSGGADIHNIYEQAIEFFEAGTDEPESFCITQRVFGRPFEGIPTIDIEQLGNRITINQLIGGNDWKRVYASHRHSDRGWVFDPVINFNLNSLNRVLNILGGKVNLATGADIPLIEEVATEKVIKVPPNPSIFWITHEASYLKSKMTCVRHPTRTHTQAKLDAYYLISEGYSTTYDYHQQGRYDEISDCEPMPESVCHLLIKFFGYEICEYDDSAIEIDLLCIWQGPQDPNIRPSDKNWFKWLNLSRFRWGVYSELLAIMEGRLNVDRLPQYPWNSQHRSITGWDCGEYIIEVPFCSFNSETEAEEFGESCYALQTDEEHPSLFQLFYGDGEQACIRKSDVIVVFPSNERLSWDDADLRIQEDVSRLQISGPLYCQGREFKGGPHHAN